jgi:tRNA pseudouridine38-40 synthase
MRNFKLTVAYDGTNYFGWQAQADKVTVQVTLEAAVERITGEKVRLHASGRTDTGVHALGQVASFHSETKLPPEVLQKALNANLPEDIVVLDACEVPDDFHPRYSAKRKHYRYLIYNGQQREIFLRHYAWYYKRGRLDVEAMQRAAKSLLGTHDFTSFESSGAKRKTSVRTIFSLDIQRGRAGKGSDVGQVVNLPIDPAVGQVANLPHDVTHGLTGGESLAALFANNSIFPFPVTNLAEWIALDIIADGFLYNMVRAILGTLVEVGRGAQSENWPGEVLIAADRCLAGPTAPPQGLFLVNVTYDSLFT